MIGLTLTRLALVPSLIAIAGWFVAWRRARPDLAPRWLVAKLTVLCLVIAARTVAGAFHERDMVTVLHVIADVVAAAVALRLWIERRPTSLAAEDAAREARRLANSAVDLADAAERTMKKGRHGRAE